MSDETTPEVPPPPPKDPKQIDPCGSPNGYHESNCPNVTITPASEPANR
jgi:hypothetical protein